MDRLGGEGGRDPGGWWNNVLPSTAYIHAEEELLVEDVVHRRAAGRLQQRPAPADGPTADAAGAVQRGWRAWGVIGGWANGNSVAHDRFETLFSVRWHTNANIWPKIY